MGETAISTILLLVIVVVLIVYRLFVSYRIDFVVNEKIALLLQTYYSNNLMSPT